jgi:hypothetical protein
MAGLFFCRFCRADVMLYRATLSLSIQTVKSKFLAVAKIPSPLMKGRATNHYLLQGLGGQVLDWLASFYTNQKNFNSFGRHELGQPSLILQKVKMCDGCKGIASRSACPSRRLKIISGGLSFICPIAFQLTWLIHFHIVGYLNDNTETPHFKHRLA